MAVNEHLEVERKYDVDLVAPAPTFSDAGEAVDSILRAVYFDTADLRLLARKITLRWRAGEAEEGWHLKLPAGADRRELQVHAVGVDPDAPRVPLELPGPLALRLRAWVRERPLVPVARLLTIRAQTCVGCGTFCDDQVTATRLIGDGEPRTLSWREWELELDEEPDPGLVEQADALIRRHGGRTAQNSSKLARALGRTAPGSAKTSHAPPTTGAFLAERLALARDLLCAQDFPVRTGAFDSVHQLRVSTRTIRSLLQAFRPFLRAAPTKQLSDELRWLAAELGAARDAEVRAERFTALAQKRGKGKPGPGEVAETLAAEERAAYRLAHREVLRALDSQRYFRLLEALDGYVADPPVRKADTRTPASTALADAVAGAAQRLFAADAAFAGAERSPGDHEEALHEVRKRAKGLRYVGELAEQAGAALPPSAWLKPVKQLQELLGEHQDAVILRDWLQERSARDHDSAFRRSLERLIAGEQARAKKAAAAYPAALAVVQQAFFAI